MTFEVILPCLNEAGALPWVIDRLRAGYQALVIDSGTSDGSAEIARTPPSRGTNDQNLLPGCDAPGVQALERGEPRHRDDGGLLEAQPGGLANKFVLSRSGVFGERAPGDAEHLVTDLEPGDIGADRGDRARHVQPRDVVLRPDVNPAG